MAIVSNEQVIKVLRQYNPWWRMPTAMQEESKPQKRQAYHEALKILNHKSIRRFVVLSGVRRVGKTTILYQIMEHMINEGIDPQNILYATFDNPVLKLIDVQSVLSIYESLYPISGTRYLFFDEIQECPNARTALKFLAMDNRYDVIASGSLLGLHYREMTSIPVGYERTMEMFSLDFEEFLWAIGKNPDAVAELRKFFAERAKVDDGVNRQFMEALREYLVVGGMPEVVNTFLRTNNYQEAYGTQKKIMESYREDIKHYASAAARQKISDCYLSIPRQLAKEYTKFQYKVVSREGNARRYENSLNWLVDAGMVKLCVNVSTPQFPLVAYEKPDQFKVYVTDIGLLTSLYGYETQAALLKDTLTGPAKGGIYENLVFDMLIKRGIVPNYYKNEKNTQEIEFLFAQNGAVIPVEVKSKRGATVSLNNFIEEFAPPYAYKLIAGNVGVSGTKITMPLYMAMFI